MRVRVGMFVGAMVLSVLSAQAQLLMIETPKPSAVIAQQFSIQGTSAGFDALHVWAQNPGGPTFLGAAYPVCPPPGAASICRWELLTTLAPEGTYGVTVYGHDAATNTWPTEQAVSVTVVRGPHVSSGFGGNALSIYPTALDDAFTVLPGSGPHMGGVVQFGRPFASLPTCMVYVEGNHASITATRTEATVALTSPGSLSKIQVMCGGGR